MYINLGSKLFLCFSLLINGSSLGQKIAGGRMAAEGEFPYAVRIGGGTMCGASLFTLKKFVTAAHCFEKELANGTIQKRDLNISYVIGGTVNYRDTTGGYQRRTIISYTIANGYLKKNSGGMYNDIAIGELNIPYKSSNTVKLLTIKTKDPKNFKQFWEELVKSGEKCVVIGWGYLQNNKPSEVLNVVEFIPCTNKQCKDKATSSNDEDKTEEGDICASPVNAGEKVMAGDSGGPLICSGNVWGVLSSCTQLSKRDPSGIPICHFILFFKYLDELKLNEAEESSATPEASTDLPVATTALPELSTALPKRSTASKVIPLPLIYYTFINKIYNTFLFALL